MTIETKFNVNEQCFFILGNRVVQSSIMEIEITMTADSTIYVGYKTSEFGQEGSIAECFVFATKEELLASL